MESLPGPEAGRLLAPVVGYVTRRAAKRQAALWNTVLRQQAKGSDGAEYVVEVGPRDPDGTWKLIWRPLPEQHKATGTTTEESEAR